MAMTSVLVCHGDDLTRRALGRTVEVQGFTLAGVASTAVELLRLQAYTRASAVIIGNELSGLTAVEVTPELVAVGVRVIVVSHDSLALAQARQAGAYAAIPRNDLAALEDALAGLGHEVTSGDRRSGSDRRRGHDRRVVQDWAQVIRERRSGQDQRKSSRRQPDAAAADLRTPASH